MLVQFSLAAFGFESADNNPLGLWSSFCSIIDNYFLASLHCDGRLLIPPARFDVSGKNFFSKRDLFLVCFALHGAHVDSNWIQRRVEVDVMSGKN